jgi:hypothetical protein
MEEMGGARILCKALHSAMRNSAGVMGRLFFVDDQEAK